MVLYIFPLGILYKVISVIMFLTILDHLPIQTICFHLLFYLLFLCGLAYRMMLRFLHFLFYKAYVSHMHDCYSCSLLSICDINFSQKKKRRPSCQRVSNAFLASRNVTHCIKDTIVRCMVREEPTGC